MEKILVIDDEQGVVELLQEVLQNAGYEVETQIDPKKALKNIKKNNYDIIITDLKMPEVDGIQITEEAKKVNEDIEVVVITGYASLGSAIDALKRDVFDYIFKPFSVSDILVTVKKVIERIRLRKHNRELDQKVEKALSDMTLLHEISKIINTSDEVEEIITFALSAIETSLELDMVSIMLFDTLKDEFYIKESVGFTKKTAEKFIIKRNEGIIGQAIKSNDTVDIAGFENDKNYKDNVADSDKKKIKNFIVIPLNVQNLFEGIITLHQLDTEVEEDKEKLRLTEVMAVQIAPMIRLGMYSSDRETMLTDSLFGAKMELAQTIKKAGDYRGTLSILIFNLYLKKNANYNMNVFEVGDVVMKHITTNISPIDRAVKIGLSSFMVILQGKTKMLTEGVATKIKSDADDDPVMKENGILLDYGYADFPMDGQTFDVLISKAQGSLWKFVKKS
ncbi:MAG: response regulator [bacterium]|nr:response regulator [bacterium]